MAAKSCESGRIYVDWGPLDTFLHLEFPTRADLAQTLLALCFAMGTEPLNAGEIEALAKGE